ncbi:MAG: hypothetical protein KatS3mg002_1578 [Candidatus Woesearchaeota archaeon]|nr:MAG: hypothetical protein KatS3mg002_1578 [Candidatus Woesearchaeota archaeon]
MKAYIYLIRTKEYIPGLDYPVYRYRTIETFGDYVPNPNEVIEEVHILDEDSIAEVQYNMRLSFDELNGHEIVKRYKLENGILYVSVLGEDKVFSKWKPLKYDLV